MQDNQGAGFFRLPDSLPADLAKMKRMVAQFKDGTVSATQFQVFRVPQGVYEQRESGKFMLRIRLPAGGLLPHQMRILADVAETYGNGILHVTTRQDIQVHRVSVDNIHPALSLLATVGLSAKGGGGNTVRNITACGHAGVCPNQAFDVTPYAVALTEFMLADPASFQLPRKYKIGFSGCARDCTGATMNDVGFIAKANNGDQSFSVWVAGGMGAHSRVADSLEESVDTSEIFNVAEAVKRVFDKHGNRKNKHKARLRFLVEQIGFDAFRDMYREELDALRREPVECPSPRPLPHPEPDAPTEPPATAAETFDCWRGVNVSPQKQDGYFIAEIPLLLGDIQADTIRKFADVVDRHGEKMLRTTQWQNVVLRWVRQDELPALHGSLAELGLADILPPVLRNLVCCTGSATCRLGICLSRGLADAIARALRKSDIDMNALGNLKIQISGCPNSCGRHPIADIGLFGAARRIAGRLVPHYVLQLGGKVAEGRTRLARGRNSIPGKNIPALLVDLIGGFEQSTQYPDFGAYLDAGGMGVAEDLAAKYKPVPDFDEDKNFYYDWSADVLFSLAGRGPGECGAGVFDLIDVDLKSSAEAIAEGRYFAATALAARALLVTRGEQPTGDAESLSMFQKHFVSQGLVDSPLDKVIANALKSASAPDPEASAPKAEEAAALLDAVKKLYDSMDASLKFISGPAPEKADPAAAEPADDDVVPDTSKDFRGVACPLNYVKTKLTLEQMSGGEVLSILLDEQGARNVPDSAASDGHEVISITQETDHWRVVIRKGK